MASQGPASGRYSPRPTSPPPVRAGGVHMVLEQEVLSRKRFPAAALRRRCSAPRLDARFLPCGGVPAGRTARGQVAAARRAAVPHSVSAGSPCVRAVAERRAVAALASPRDRGRFGGFVRVARLRAWRRLRKVHPAVCDNSHSHLLRTTRRAAGDLPRPCQAHPLGRTRTGQQRSSVPGDPAIQLAISGVARWYERRVYSHAIVFSIPSLLALSACRPRNSPSPTSNPLLSSAQA